jgi:putative ABC transport system substrate-binding protein
MRRRRVLMLLAASAIRPTSASAQIKVPRLGYIWQGAAGSDDATLGGLRRGLKELGYEEGRTIVLERRYADGRLDRLPAIVAELVLLPVDIIAAAGTPATREVQKATRMIPVVSTSGDPVRAGFVASLSRPGGNITGLTLGSSEAFAGKWLEFLAEAVPSLHRVAVLHAELNPANAQELAALGEAARRLGVELVPASATAANELEPALARIAATAAGGLIVTDSPLFAAARERIVAFAGERRLPAVYGLEEFVPAGGLMSYSSSVFDIWRRAAGYIDRILKGARPAAMPVEEPTVFELRVNLRAARAIGLALPPALLAHADEVIE